MSWHRAWMQVCDWGIFDIDLAPPRKGDVIQIKMS